MPPSSLAHKACCRRLPRCGDCPVLLVGELRSLKRALEEPTVAAHLEGVPACLHRYEALLEHAYEARQRRRSDSAP